MNTKIEDNIERYLKTSIYTYAGASELADEQD